MSLRDQRSFVGASKVIVTAVTEAFFDMAVQMIVGAHKRMRSDVNLNPGWKETKFSACILGHMLKYKEQHDLQVNVVTEPPCLDEEMITGDADPDKAPRIDIKVQQWCMPEEVYITFECKRLDSRDSSLQRLYVTEGILRFVSGKYSNKHQYGGMIAFVISGDVANLVASINQYIAGRRDLGQTHCLVCEASTGNLYSSDHPRDNPFPSIRLRHVFCPFAFKQAQ